MSFCCTHRIANGPIAVGFSSATFSFDFSLGLLRLLKKIGAVQICVISASFSGQLLFSLLQQTLNEDFLTFYKDLVVLLLLIMHHCNVQLQAWHCKAALNITALFYSVLLYSMPHDTTPPSIVITGYVHNESKSLQCNCLGLHYITLH